MNHKPMLAVDCGNLDGLTYPRIASPKYDGVRCIVGEGLRALSRSLKPIPNDRVRALLEGLPVGVDGELLVGDPTAPDAYRKTVSMVMSDDAPVDGLVYHIFDIQSPGTFEERYNRLTNLFAEWTPWRPGVALVPQVYVWSRADLDALEAEWVGNQGHEGVILRKGQAPYKHGRSTRKEGYLLKVKRFVDGEAEVIGVTELMHNGNEAKTNALGRTERSHKKAGMVPTGRMGTLVARTDAGVVFEIGTGFTALERRVLFPMAKRRRVIGETEDKMPIYALEHVAGGHGDLAKYKHFPSGSKDKPRHPVFLGWRDKRDL